MRKSITTARMALCAATMAMTFPAWAADTDGDGVTDDVDNCTLTANPNQTDTDSDGIGNNCDADTNNDGLVNFGDLAAFKNAFLSPDLEFDFNDDGDVNFGDLARLKQLFLKTPGPSAANCSPVDAGLPADEAYGAEMFMRGSLYADWAAENPGNNYTNQGDGIYTAKFAIYAGDYEFKVADSGWTIERSNFIDPLILDTPLTLTNAGVPTTNGTVIVPADGCYNFAMNTTDAASPQLSMTAIAGDCTIADQGNDNTAAFGVEMFMRGGLYMDWAAVNPGNNFINYGGAEYQARFQAVAGTFEYKVADSGWTTERSNNINVLQPGATITIQALSGGFGNTVFSTPEDACYEFTLDVSGGTDTPTISAAKQ